MKMLLGGILFAVGLLVMGLAGLCSGYVCVALLLHGDGNSESEVITMGLLPVIGGIPFAMGFGLFFAGRALIRSARRDQESG